MAAALEQSRDYRILRRLVPRPEFAASNDEAAKTALLLDVETIGVNSTRDQIIELGTVKFAYLPDGRTTRARDTFSCLNQLSVAIPRGYGSHRGHNLDPNRVAAFAADAVVVIVYNAAFDRTFMERYCPSFEHQAWACSVSEIEWRSHGFEGSRLPYLLMKAGLFHEAHRAVDDCLALLEIQPLQLPDHNRTVLSALLERARRKTTRIWAEHSPFEPKDELKTRGYRWSDGIDGRPKSWYIDVDESDRDAEIVFLQRTIYQREVEFRIQSLTALTAFP